jgi:hypothetical protein
MEYIGISMGREWGNAELKKPLEERHPILVWYHYLCQYQQALGIQKGKVNTVPSIGAVSAYLNLAYDLYLLAHNVNLQEKLIDRLKDKENFFGARYEVFVAASLIRAGFIIEFEDENDRSSTHCEFTATFTRTGRKFSVEAKYRTGNKFRLGRQLNRALSKRANHERIVFVDVNVPDSNTDESVPKYLSNALIDLRAFEGRHINGRPLPSAYLVVTNSPWHHHLESGTYRCTAMAEGFQIADFKMDTEFRSLRAAIDAREKHIELFNVLSSMRDCTEIPSTFDGEIPEFAFGEAHQRLLIGQRYSFSSSNGEMRTGILTRAIVNESERSALCAMSFEDGSAHICKWPLSDTEMAAWRRHPDTFFGAIERRSHTADDPLELYDFFLISYKQTPKERLIELLAAADDIEELKQLNQPQLASIYAERCTYSALASQAAAKA